MPQVDPGGLLRRRRRHRHAAKAAIAAAAVVAVGAVTVQVLPRPASEMSGYPYWEQFSAQSNADYLVRGSVDEVIEAADFLVVGRPIHREVVGEIEAAPGRAAIPLVGTEFLLEDVVRGDLPDETVWVVMAAPTFDPDVELPDDQHVLALIRGTRGFSTSKGVVPGFATERQGLILVGANGRLVSALEPVSGPGQLGEDEAAFATELSGLTVQDVVDEYERPE